MIANALAAESPAFRDRRSGPREIGAGKDFAGHRVCAPVGSTEKLGRCAEDGGLCVVCVKGDRARILRKKHE